MAKHFNELSKKLNSFQYQFDLSNLFNDLLTMGICAYHSTNIQSQLQIKDEANEALYLETIKGYSKEQLITLSEALGILQLNVLDAPYTDLLGEFFMQEISKGHNGQFFTPDSLCEMMASFCGIRPEDENKNCIDPACGSGRMLLAGAKMNPNHYFYGADNSQVCAKMATLNFFLNGLRGEVAWMNTLSMEWYGGWHINLNGLGITPIKKEQSLIWTDASKVKAPEKIHVQSAKVEGKASTKPDAKPSNTQPSQGQLSLF